MPDIKRYRGSKIKAHDEAEHPEIGHTCYQMIILRMPYSPIWRANGTRGSLGRSTPSMVHNFAFPTTFYFITNPEFGKMDKKREY